VVIVVPILASAGGLQNAWGGTQKTVSLNVGVIMPTTGGLSLLGKPMTNGVKMAEQDAAKKGGLPAGVKLTWSYGDDQGDRNQSVSLAQQFIAKKSVAIVGPLTSTQTLALGPIADGSRVTTISPSAAQPGLTSISKFLFTAAPSLAEQDPLLVKYAKLKWKSKRVAIMGCDDDPVEQADIKLFKGFFKNNGIQIVDEQHCSNTALDYSQQLTHIMSSNYDTFVTIALAGAQPRILRQAGSLGVLKGKHVIASVSANSASTIAAAGSATEGMLMVGYYTASNTSRLNRAFVSRYVRLYKEQPGEYSVKGYIAAKAVVEAIKKAKLTGDISKDRIKVRDALATLRKFQTPVGTINTTRWRGVYPRGAPGILLLVKNGTIVANPFQIKNGKVVKLGK
jgi:branched-chain amino acid transport system substrate-binding protein